jgi:hypothetical protein
MVTSSFVITQDVYKSTYHLLNVSFYLLFNLLEYWMFSNTQMDNFIKLIDIDR